METLGKMKLYDSLTNKNSFVSIGFECLDRDMFRPEKCYDILGKTGVKHARVQTGWIKCEKEKGVYDFSWLDDITDNLLSRGIEPWFNVSFGNPIYMKDISQPSAVGCVPIVYGKETMDAWLRYVHALAVHYKGKIHSFEIWNEADTKSFWYPGYPNPSEYAELTLATGDTIREVIPDAEIGGCVAIRNWEYLDEYFRKLPVGKIDFFCLHLYMIKPEENYFESIDFLRRIMDKHGHINCKIRQGEAGFPSWFPEKHFYKHTKQSNEHQQAVWMLRRFFLDAAAGLDLSNYFQMADMWEKAYEKANETLKKPAAQGIVNGITYTPKKAVEVISRISNLFAGGTSPLSCYATGDYDGNGTLLHPCARTIFSYIKGSKPFFAYYVPTFVQEEREVKNDFWLDIEKRDGWDINSGFAVIDMISGDVYKAEPRSETELMLRFKNLPYADYPFVLCPCDMIEYE